MNPYFTSENTALGTPYIYSKTPPYTEVHVTLEKPFNQYPVISTANRLVLQLNSQGKCSVSSSMNYDLSSAAFADKSYMSRWFNDVMTTATLTVSSIHFFRPWGDGTSTQGMASLILGGDAATLLQIFPVGPSNPGAVNISPAGWLANQIDITGICLQSIGFTVSGLAQSYARLYTTKSGSHAYVDLLTFRNNEIFLGNDKLSLGTNDSGQTELKLTGEIADGGTHYLYR